MKNNNYLNFIIESIKLAPLLWGLIIVLFLFPIISLILDKPFWNDIAMRIMLLGIAGIGLNIAFGFGGMVSLGHALFIGIGAYSVGILNFFNFTNIYMHIALSIFASGFFGFIIGILSLRTSGIYFIMITLAFAQMFYFLFISLEIFGGDDGLSTDRSEFLIFDIYKPLRLYYVIALTLFLSAFVSCITFNSRFGVSIRAIKFNASRCESLGINLIKFRITAFIFSAIICGISGTLFANWQEYVSPDIMHWTKSGEILIVIILGGLGTLSGPMIGAVVFYLLEEFLPELIGVFVPEYQENWMLIFGPLLIIIVFFGKGGAIALIKKFFNYKKI